MRRRKYENYKQLKIKLICNNQYAIINYAKGIHSGR